MDMELLGKASRRVGRGCCSMHDPLPQLWDAVACAL